jgi:hypothetical protein
MKTTAENNLMICKFMGLVPEYELLDPLFNITYKYHTSWDWLMPVVEKIYSMDGVELDTRDIETVIDRPISIKLEDMHYVVCEFIEWYNTRKEEGQ